jgi:hypothetical protein
MPWMMPFGRAREGELGLNDPHQAERGGHAAGAGIGHAVQLAAAAARTAQQVAKTKELFLGKSNKGELNRNYERAAAVLSHAATPLINGTGP